MADHMNMMEEKWRIVFKLLDINKDGTMSAQDRDACKQSFSSMYTANTADIEASMDSFWNYLVFPGETPDWSQSLSEDAFVGKMKQVYLQDKSKVIESIKSAVHHLISVADNDKDGVFTFDKFFKFHVAFNLAHDIIVRTTFNLIGPSAEDKCTFDQILAFYIELFIGEDKDKFEALKNAYRAIGML